MSTDLVQSDGFGRSFEARLRLAPQDEGREAIRHSEARANGAAQVALCQAEAHPILILRCEATASPRRTSFLPLHSTGGRHDRH